MQRFILEQNITRFRRKLAEEADEGARRSIQSLLSAAERSLALLNADAGVSGPRTPLEARNIGQTAEDILDRFRKEFSGASRPSLLIDPGPGLNIVDANDAFVASSGKARAALVGRRMFDVFPDNPADPDADGMSNLFASLKMAATTGRPHVMEVQRYDVTNADGAFVKRYWRPVTAPLLDEFGQVIFLLHQAEEATEEVLAAQAAD